MVVDPNNPIRIDPFFEGEGLETQREGVLVQPNTGGLVQPNIGGAAPVASGGPVQQQPGGPGQQQPGYVDVGDRTLGDGRTVAQAMRPGPAGLRGTIIPSATPGGVPAGVRPHETRNLIVNIDPHLDGQGAQVRLGDVNPQTVARAEEMAREVTPDPYDTPTTRMRAAAVMQGIAAQGHQAVGDISQYQPPPVTPVTAPGNIPGAHQAQIATPVPPPARRVRPLEHFGQEGAVAKAHETGPSLRRVDTPGAPPEYEALPPRIRVNFEIEGFGVHQANYHDIIVQDGFLVLVYDEGYPAGLMYEPPAGDQTPAMALEVLGANEVHLVHTTGFSYSYQGHRFCILMIERSAPVQAEPTQPRGQ